MSCNSQQCIVLLREVTENTVPELARKLTVTNLSDGSEVRDGIIRTLAIRALRMVLEDWVQPRPAPESNICEGARCDCEIIETTWGDFTEALVSTTFTVLEVRYSTASTVKRRFGEGRGRCELGTITTPKEFIAFTEGGQVIAVKEGTPYETLAHISDLITTATSC